ncbi:rhomboid family intramembrane serine protease GlpG [Mixta intestinalis]|uniref:Rhomboid protease GlpG n=1 Tax=Mixta intestinalis TaxID=1615494 RepID=A0A6P1Q384_9GAMM|nr:rhomboid family intramembrane serine protease GlpG [Mixta intestinalis]QHM73480.1 Rhomboid protease GlpG [Mixta intestinalis]
MIRLTGFANPRMAQSFVDYMAIRGIPLYMAQEDRLTLLLEDDTKQEMVENELKQFLNDPQQPRYRAASWQSGHIDRGLLWQGESLLALLRQRAGPFTMTLSLLCCVIFFAMWLFGDLTMLAWLGWRMDGGQFSQPWRWFSHILLHLTLLHLVFNLLWWWYIGGMIEKHLGSSKLLVITLISALLGGWLQAEYSEISFSGLTCVVYTLMGYAWLRGERDTEGDVFLPRGLIVFTVLWFAISYSGILGASASIACIFCLTAGLVMAFIDTRHQRYR